MKLKVADYIINFFSQKGIDTAFLVYGAANGDLVDSFTRNSKIKYVATIHEQVAGFAAEGYSKIKRIPGLAISTSGPGATNMITSVANCFYDSIPCIFLSGQINSQFLRPHEKIRQIGFQETDIISIVKPVSKFAVMIENANDIKYILEKAFHICLEGRPGPVFLDIPVNIQKAEIDVDELEGFNPQIRKYDIEDISLKIRNFLDDFNKAKRPAFIIGGGVQLSNTLDKLINIVKKLKVPCFPTWNGLDSITSDFEYYGGRIGTYGGPGRNLAIQNSDLIFGIGTRISGRITGGNVRTFAREAKKYIVDLDEFLLEKKYQQVPFDVNIFSDLPTFFDIFEEEIKKIKKINEKNDWLEKVKYWLKKYNTFKPLYERENAYSFESKNYIHPYNFLDKLSNQLDKKDIIVGDCGGCSVLVGHALKTKLGQRYHSNNGHAPMGFSFASAIGSWFGSDKKSNVICLTGDGGFNMNIQDLQTLINYNIPLKTFVINNHIYGITKAFQKTNFQGREEACGPKGYNPPDFVAVAKAYKIKTFIIDKNINFEDTIKEILKFNGPVVCDVNCHEFHDYEPKIIGWKTPIEDMYPYIERNEFKKEMIIKPTDTVDNPFMPDIASKSGTME
jgi:acetolactate synthase-1/2/3 large subunit